MSLTTRKTAKTSTRDTSPRGKEEHAYKLRERVAARQTAKAIREGLPVPMLYPLRPSSFLQADIDREATKAAESEAFRYRHTLTRSKPAVIPEGMRWCRCHWGNGKGEVLPSNLFGAQVSNNICAACDREAQRAQRNRRNGFVRPTRTVLEFPDDAYNVKSAFQPLDFGPPTAQVAAEIVERIASYEEYRIAVERYGRPWTPISSWMSTCNEA
ncbi:hypothetical protein [Variovorax paradoxus]|uniref:hypothetical protein n=1 Tax=Variovorax paradoxus TaxID=34073 RepID=UPI00277EEFEF|nr:hypothetical protein [Variovorax paradoxus]MDQ0591356.1 hypothetical protein [Variovorax paradoxus]